MIRLTWFNVFGNAAPLYMASLAFTAYGIHWFAMAHRRYIGSSAQPDSWMAIGFLFLSLLGTGVFLKAGDIPVMIVFIGLSLIYAAEIPTNLIGLEFWPSIGGLVAVFHRDMADVLHLCSDSQLRAGCEGLDLVLLAELC
jgi:hypothetical protein